MGAQAGGSANRFALIAEQAAQRDRDKQPDGQAGQVFDIAEVSKFLLHRQPDCLPPHDRSR
jgi:hypothetical protein